MFFMFIILVYKPNRRFIIIIDKSKFTEKKVNNQILCLSPELLLKKNIDGTILQTYIKTSPGRILLNQSFEHEYEE